MEMILIVHEEELKQIMKMWFKSKGYPFDESEINFDIHYSKSGERHIVCEANSNYNQLLQKMENIS